MNNLLPTFPAYEQLKELIQLARREDLAGEGEEDDVTSRLLVPAEKMGVGTLIQKETGITCGLPMVEMICRAYDERLRVELIPGFHLDIIEGRFSDQRTTPLLRVRGPMRPLLAAERVILNFLQRLGGVATQTHRYVKRIAGTAARIYDTRKTLPGFRLLDKYAVRAGGGQNHRIGLHDGLLVKDNHLADKPVRELIPFLTRIVQASRGEAPNRLVEVEVETLEQFREVLKVEGIDVVLLDNMDCPAMEQAVQLKKQLKRPVALEASGGITLDTVRSVAQTGVDRIAVGAITHSATALDNSLEVEEG
jgi:nicotinate-nucleotide pyrophosphorylase (carboxylating)